MKEFLKESILRNRKGFAIVLVAALAGLVFLLGASLVVMSQMQSAASQYDQRLRLARDNARVSLEMALGDLQRYAGRDQVVTYMSDVYRKPIADNFNTPTATGAAVGVNQAFWTAAYDGASETWLVTRPISSSDAPADPRDSTAGYVTLVGAKTAVAAKQSVHNVQVPKEPLVTSGLIGYDSNDEKIIGHYAYWIGDMGVKASYAIYNRNANVKHDVYEVDATKTGENGETIIIPNSFRRRLEQMRMSKPSIDLLDVNLSSTVIDDFVSDFQIREKSGADSGWTILAGLTPLEEKKGFHDFSGLSKGLLTNTVSGGLKMDLTANPNYNAELKQYANLAYNLTPSAISDSGLKMEYDVSWTATELLPAIHPVLTQFNLRTSVWTEVDGTDASLRISYNVALEFWNPYTSALNQKEDFKVVIQGLPNLSGSVTGISDTPQIFELNLSNSSDIWTPTYSITGNGTIWSPGEIRVFSGDAGPFISSLPNHSDYEDALIVSSTPPVFTRTTGDFSAGELSFRFTDPDNSTVSKPASVSVALYDHESTLINSYSLETGAFEIANEPESIPLISARGNETFGFAWEVEDAAILSDAYNPFSFIVPNANSVIVNFSNNVLSDSNTIPLFDSGTSTLIGHHPDGIAYTDGSFRIPLVELPRQELTSVSMLRKVSDKGFSSNRIGEVDSTFNYLFDTAFFSTVSKEDSVGQINIYELPNSFYEVIGTNDMGDLQNSNSAQSLFVRGSFNINSTSIRAWEAVLKGININSWTYVDSAEDEGKKTITSTNTYQFFNYTQSAEETYSGSYSNVNQANKQKSFRRGIVMLTDAQILTLATQIVSKIRLHNQVKGTGKPFVSIEDFLDSDILKAAIGAAKINPGGIIANSPSYLSQATIMNAIASYISARSDTFVIRAYGDAVEPSDPNQLEEPEVWSRAYCEAIVQRVHAKHATDKGSGGVMMPTNNVAGEFGRQFKVVAFRWLSPSDI